MVAGFINTFTVIGTIFVMPIFLQLVRGFRPSEVALVLAPVAFAAAVVGPFGGWISDRLGFFPPIGFGMLLRGLSFLMLSWLSPVSGFIFMLITLFINGVGLGFTASPTLNAAVSVSENGEYGMTAGLYSMVQYIGGAVGVSITSVIVYSRVPSPEALKTMTTSVPGFSHSFVFLAGLCVAGFLVSLAMRTEKSYRTARRKTNAPTA